MTDQLIGQTFDRYQIVSHMGDGRLGATYKAIDPSLQREVALKLIRVPEGRTDLADAITRQARLAAQLDNPGLVRVHDSGRTGAWVYVVTDYIPGGNLAQLLQDLRSHNQWLLLAEAVGLTRQLGLVLDYLGRQGLPPRAVKPDDVMLKPDPFDGLPFRVVLTSLGLEPEESAAPSGWPANPNSPAPAYAYWSPEKALGAPLDARSEVYSLGALLYELAVGWQPFPAQTLAEAVRLHTQAALPQPRSRRADLPEALEAVIVKALEQDRANRYPDPAALAQALAEVMPAAQEVDRTPAAAAWTVSLLAAYQRSLGAGAVAPLSEGAGRPAGEQRAFFRFNGTVVDANLVQTSPNGRVGVYIEVPQFTVTPGQPTSTGIVIVNLGPELDHFSLSLSGLTPGWLAPPQPPTSLPLAPGDSRRVTVIIAPPRSPLSRAGHYHLTVRVASQSQPDQAVEARLTVTVAAFSQFQSELTTPNLQAGEPARLLVHNLGNTPEAYVVNFDDPDDKLTFEPAFLNFSVPEGQKGAAEFIVRRRQVRLVGDQRVYPFGLRIAASAEEAQKLTAEVATHALIPLWLLLAAVFGCCLVAAVSALAYNGLQASGANTATAAAQQTGNAVAQQTISVVATRLAVNASLTPATATTTGTPTVTRTPTVTGTPPPTPTPTITGTPTQTFTPAPPTATGTPAPPTNTSTPVPPSATLAPVTPTTPAPPTVTLTLAPPATTAAPTATTVPPAGGRVLFVSSRTGQPNIYVVNSNGTGETPLSSAGANQNPAWSAAAQRIAFESTRDGNLEIYSMLLDGSSQTRLTNNPAADTSPAWSPDGAHIAFVTNRDGHPEIYLMNPDGSNQTRLTNSPAPDTVPAWAPDGARLAFVSERDGMPAVYLMNADGSGQTRLITDTVAESDPVWAPNGAWIVYVRDTGSKAAIYLTTSNGSGQLRLTNSSAADTQPVWAPNGGRLAFVSQRDGHPEIYSMLADGSQQTRLTNSAGGNDHPIWSPAGDRIAFASTRDGSPQVYVMNADGSNQTRLTNDGSTDVPGVWLP